MKFFNQELSAKKNHFLGTHRLRSPEDTFNDYSRFMAQMGITRIANVTGLDRIGVPVCVAIRPNARALASAQGKGSTLFAAKTSALMEAIESWHCERIDAPLRFDSHHAMAQAFNVPNLSDLPWRSDATPSQDRPFNWIEAYDIVEDRALWLPFELVSTNFVQAHHYQPSFLQSSNGLASGNHLLEATVHALYEIIERDALALWELTPQSQRKNKQVNLNTVNDKELNELIQKLTALGIVVSAWEITSDIGLPVFTATIYEDPDSLYWRHLPAFSGHGCHLQPEIALSRAIYEAIQSRATVISGSRDDIFPRDYEQSGNKEDHEQAIAKIRFPEPTQVFPKTQLPVGNYFEEDLNTIIQQLKTIGLNSIAMVNLTRADIGIPVVKLVVPGLEPFHTSSYRAGKRAADYLQKIAA